MAVGRRCRPRGRAVRARRRRGTLDARERVAQGHPPSKGGVARDGLAGGVAAQVPTASQGHRQLGQPQLCPDVA